MSAFLRACTKSFVPVLCTALLSAPTAVPTAAARSASATVSVCRAANGSSLQLTLSWSGFRANWWRHQLYEYDPDTTVGVGEEELSATSSSGTLTWTLYLDSPSPTQEDLDAMDRGYGGVYYVDSKGNTTDGPYQTVERPATGWATCA